MAENRHYGLDLLRIIAMFMIVLGHSISHSEIKAAATPFEPSFIIAWLMLAFVLSATNCYVLISGYFLSAREQIKTERIKKLIGTVFFYSVTIALILFACGFQIGIRQIPQIIFPVLTNSYWFITAYLAMFLLAPYMNKLISVLGKQDYMRLLAAGAFLLCIWPTFFIAYLGKLSPLAWIGWFSYLYLVAGYIRKFGLPFKKWHYAAGYALFSLMPFAAKMTLSYILLKYRGSTEGSAFLYEYNFIFLFPASVCLFMLFEKISIDNAFFRKFISAIAPLTLAVYIITEHFLLRKAFWHYIVPQDICGSGLKMMFALIAISSAVFSAAAFIEYMRRLITGAFAKYVHNR